VRGLDNVKKKLLIQTAACNLALLMISFSEAGKPRVAQGRKIDAVFAILTFLAALDGLRVPNLGPTARILWNRHPPSRNPELIASFASLAA